jgi:hypothetical protein
MHTSDIIGTGLDFVVIDRPKAMLVVGDMRTDSDDERLIIKADLKSPLGFVGKLTALTDVEDGDVIDCLAESSTKLKDPTSSTAGDRSDVFNMLLCKEKCESAGIGIEIILPFIG